ncbi:zinc uptake regulation protein [Planobispora rosea]|uniref:Zinc uptake regulation protein n=1 Tax=Planobispora rosea TaxID=35762 RepID=A0A8J3S5Q0_PLARO|nr:Fur family transcriptional regulator [Planobispora rosea]GGT03990.1 zinc uptake regulation protein [Planobispora rosea]GIH88796.1 zinc uptake regulation protein [Planobispora rosea]
MEHRDVNELRARGMTATASRLLILRCLRSQPEPRSAGEIYTHLRSHGDRVGLTTVYRALATLTGTGLVHAFDRNGETAYRICGEDDHCHMVCRTCAAVTEVAVSALESVLVEGFRIEEIHGTCPSCRKE